MLKHRKHSLKVNGTEVIEGMLFCLNRISKWEKIAKLKDDNLKIAKMEKIEHM